MSTETETVAQLDQYILGWGQGWQEAINLVDGASFSELVMLRRHIDAREAETLYLEIESDDDDFKSGHWYGWYSGLQKAMAR